MLATPKLVGIVPKFDKYSKAKIVAYLLVQNSKIEKTSWQNNALMTYGLQTRNRSLLLTFFVLKLPYSTVLPQRKRMETLKLKIVIILTVKTIFIRTSWVRRARKRTEFWTLR